MGCLDTFATNVSHCLCLLRDKLGGAGKGSHRKFAHARFPGAVTLSGRDGADAKPYQEKQVKMAIEEVEE